jgi:putative flippase GtrA
MPLAPLLKRLWKSWATRSLAVGAGAVALDLMLGVSLITFAHTGSRVAAMAGTALGSTFSFFGNRYFAFRDSEQKLHQSAVRFVFTSVVLSLAHGHVVAVLRDSFNVPFVPAKIASDLVVITFTQLVILRFFVFRRTLAPSGAAERDMPNNKSATN